MQVRVLHPSLCHVGGAEILMVEQAALLRRLGASVRIRTFAYDAARWSDRVGEIPVDALKARVPGRRPPSVPRHPGDPRMAWLLDDLAGADVAIAHNYPASSALGAAAKPRFRLWYCHEPPRFLYPDEVSPFLREHAARAPARLGPRYYGSSMRSWFGALPFIGRRSAARKTRDRSGVHGLDAIWANSEYTRENVRNAYGAVDVDVVYPMIDVPESAPARHGLPSSGVAILSLSRLEWVKNLDSLVEGFALFRRRDDPHAELHIVGEGPARAPLEALVTGLGVGSAVRLHGFLSDAAVLELSARCQLFACLPLDEPFGMVFPEAMARGLLVLGPDHGGPFETLDGGRLGEVADALDPEAIAAGLARLARLSNGEADRRRALAHAAALQRFSREAVARRMKDLFERRGVRF
jgi:glycosyltransferase involved in cell wall biosynthesis